MNRIRKTFHFKVVAMTLVFLFFSQADTLLLTAQEESLDLQFVRAKEEFLKSNIADAVKRLMRLEALYKNMPNRKKEMERKYGETLLLLGACLEKLNKDKKTITGTYILAKEKFGNTFTFPDLDFSQLRIHGKVFNKERVEKSNREKVIEKENPPPGKKKKFPWLWIAGAVVVTAAVILLLTKKPKRTLTVSVGEGVDGTPISGATAYKNGASVSYNYTLKSGYSGLVVRLDGNNVTASGIIKMDKNHTLTVSASKTYALTVVKGTGVDGTPETGNYSYNNGDTVNYGYVLQNGYTGMVVKIDGSEAPANGSLIMNKDHVLTVEAVKTYTLTVTKGVGVIGLPDTGTYSYKENYTTNYNYGVQEGYTNLEVKLDGNPAPANGFINMDKNHTLTATASGGI